MQQTIMTGVNDKVVDHFASRTLARIADAPIEGGHLWFLVVVDQYLFSGSGFQQGLEVLGAVQDIEIQTKNILCISNELPRFFPLTFKVDHRFDTGQPVEEIRPVGRRYDSYGMSQPHQKMIQSEGRPKGITIRFLVGSDHHPGGLM